MALSSIAVTEKVDVTHTLVTLVLSTMLLIVSGCSARDSDYGYSGGEVRSADTAFTYRQFSPYADNLKRCVFATTVADSCSVSELPFIGDGQTTPTIDQIMERVLVTHNWMGARFEAALRNAPDDTLRTLFSSATSVLIGSDVRPSFYIATTAGIQLDANYLWTTNAEKSTVSTRSDERSDFGVDLQFIFQSRTADESGDRLTQFYSLDDEGERPVKEMEISLYRLLYHELTHANDFMPRHKIASVDPANSIFDSISNIRADWLSNNLVSNHPKSSDLLKNLAQVRYAGEDASDAQKQLTASDMGEQMSTDGAIQLYSYFSQREDLAQLVEAVLMEYHFDARFNVAFMQKPTEDSAACDDYLVGWGERNRLASPLVSVRARAAANLVLEDSAAAISYLDSKGGFAEPMTAGLNWCVNQYSGIASSSDQLRSLEVEGTKNPTSGPLFQEMLEFDDRVHPEGPIPR